MEEENIRKVLLSVEFVKFISGLDERTKRKFGENITILKKMYVISTKIVKKLVTTDRLYELRVSVGFNEYRSVIFSANHENIMQATELVMLNGFLKKDKKDYDKQIKKAINILNNIEI